MKPLWQKREICGYLMGFAACFAHDGTIPEDAPSPPASSRVTQ
jgi:hypothetical protein